jgi:hypothetical protein
MEQAGRRQTLKHASRATMSTFAPGVKPCIMVVVTPPWASAGAAAVAAIPASAARRVKSVVMIVLCFMPVLRLDLLREAAVRCREQVSVLANWHSSSHRPF